MTDKKKREILERLGNQGKITTQATEELMRGIRVIEDTQKDQITNLKIEIGHFCLA